jgi:hypothetical protein
LGSRDLSPSRSPALQLGPQGSLWGRRRRRWRPLIDQNCWENSTWYYVNVERGNAPDILSGRNIDVSFTNNSNVSIEVMVFIFYSHEVSSNAGLVNGQIN